MSKLILPPTEKGSTQKRKNRLPEEAILSFLNSPFSEGSGLAEKQTGGYKSCPL